MENDNKKIENNNNGLYFTKIDDIVDGHHTGGVKEIDLAKEMKTSFLSYAMSVIVSRALPDVRDGMKPVHRRILYAMNDLGMYSDKAYKKSARIVGEVMGKYHPHGDTAIYDSMVRMAQDFSYRYPLVEGQGNYGSIDGDGAAAMRYTEARMSKMAMELLKDLGKNTVSFKDNYDGSETEPTVFPCRFPNILVNGATGIAVGMATNIPPHNLTEIINGLLALIGNPDISIEGLMAFIKGPDFPTGGLIMGLTQVRKAYLTGSGAITIRAQVEVVDKDNNKQDLIIREIPYQVNKSKLIERIATVAKNKVIDEITDLRDESTREGIRIVIELKRGTNSSVVLNKLYKHTQLQSTFAINTLALDKGQPKVLNLKEVLVCYLEHQVDVITRRTQYDLDKAETRAHLLEGLLIALGSIDQVIQLIKKSKNTEEALNGLMATFKLSEEQAKAILDMKLQRLTALETDKIKEELLTLKKFIAECKEILSNHDKKMEIIISELIEIRDKFGDDRRTEITLSDDLDIEDADLIPVEDSIITLTERGYIKRMTADTYRPQHRGGTGITGTKMIEEDFVNTVLFTSTHDTLLFFTNFGKIYKLKAFQVPESSRLAKGLPIVNLLNFDTGEELAAVLNVEDDIDSEHYLIFATKKGIIKKTEISQFSNIRTNGIRALLLNEGDELFRVSVTDGEKDIILGTSNGKAIRFSESDIRPMGRIAAGVRGVKVEEDAEVVGMAIVSTDGDEVVIVTEKGYGKRTNVDAFRVQVRGGKGVKALNITEKNGKMVSLRTVRGDEDLMVITDRGMVIRTPLDKILTIGRDTQGVCIIKLKNSQLVASIAIVPHEEIEDETSEIDYDEKYEYDTSYTFLDENKDDKDEDLDI